MGFLDKFLSAIGFESEKDEEEVSEKKQKQETLTSAKFYLQKEEKTKRVANAPRTFEEDLDIFTPENKEEVDDVLLHLKKGENVLINLSNFEEEQQYRIIDYLAGAAFIVDKKIKFIENSLYLITKKATELTVESE